ncbi:MAG: oligoribonuclease [Fibrobacteria bacterium]|nr:oligoribonuclease [Fibrobacteria bacterium]
MEQNLVWMDLEFSGLDPNTEVILEIATIVTDKDLNILEEGPVLAIHQSDTILDNMDDWNKEHHGQSGLVDRVKKSTESHESASAKTKAFIAKYCKERTSPLCGNTIHMDRQFLHNHMPGLNEYLHYRNVDVSTIKELAKRWYPDLPELSKKKAHLALDDIRESIEELKYLREKLFIK